LSVGLAGAAWSAEPANSNSEADDILSEVVVTGSRLASGFDTPTPVTMLSSDDLNASVPNNMGESLAQLPSLAGSVQNTTSGQGSANSLTAKTCWICADWDHRAH
jgi:outer membrane cobalamin receptor